MYFHQLLYKFLLDTGHLVDLGSLHLARLPCQKVSTIPHLCLPGARITKTCRSQLCIQALLVATQVHMLTQQTFYKLASLHSSLLYIVILLKISYFLLRIVIMKRIINGYVSSQH